MRNTIVTASVLSIALFCTTPGSAAQIGIGAFSGSETLIDFETVPVTTPATGPFSIGPVTFSESSTGSGAPGWRLLDNFFVPGSRALTDNAAISNIILNFASPEQQVGLDVGIGTSRTTYDVSFFDASFFLLGTVSGSVDQTTGPTSYFFAGWENLGGISRIQIVETSGENGTVGGIDNVRFESAAVPEPGTVFLLGIGMLGLVVGYGRKRNKSTSQA